MSGSEPHDTPSQGVTPVRIERWATGGRGLGRVDGRVWLVEGGVPGDSVLARIAVDRGRFVEAVVDRISAPSAIRREAPCPVQGDCGGCPLMAVDEGRQREAKRAFVVDALERIGKLNDPPVEPVVEAPPVLGYRNKIELVFGRDDRGRRALGYHRAGQAVSIVDIERCAVADGRLARLLDHAREFFFQGEGREDPALTDTREPLRLVLRSSGSRDERLLALRGPEGPFPTVERFARTAAHADPALAGVVRIIARPGRRGGARTELVWGRGWLEEELHGVVYRVPASTFLQVHPGAAAKLGRHVIDGVGAPARVVELFGGIGTLGLPLAVRGADVTIVEADAAAIDCGREAASRTGVRTARFVRSDVSRFLRGTPAESVDLLIADPPRTGLGRGDADGIAAISPRRIAMVSCDPATLGRDVGALVSHGYALDRVVPFDLFPQTAHIEAVAWMTRPGEMRA